MDCNELKYGCNPNQRMAASGREGGLSLWDRTHSRAGTSILVDALIGCSWSAPFKGKGYAGSCFQAFTLQVQRLVCLLMTPSGKCTSWEKTELSDLAVLMWRWPGCRPAWPFR
jgi:hypothetical protein